MSDSRGIGPPLAEKVDIAAMNGPIDTAAWDRVRKGIGPGPADNNWGLMRKLEHALLNYLRNRCY